LGAAVEGGSLKANPCDGVKIPRGASSEMVFLDLHFDRRAAGTRTRDLRSPSSLIAVRQDSSRRAQSSDQG
jgi:hypothetical protein